MALQNPWLFLVGLVLFFALAVWLLPKIWRGIKRVFGFVRRKLGGAPELAENGVTSAEDGEDDVVSVDRLVPRNEIWKERPPLQGQGKLM